MRFSEFKLTERKSADLYHNTMHPVEILKSGKIKAFLDTRNDHEAGEGAKPFISLTRDPRFDFFGMGDAQFVIDQGKLATTHKITPFDYGGYSDDEAYGRRLESEERVFKDIPLSYVKKIVVQSQHNVAAKDYIPLAKELGIPVVDRKGNRLDENFADGEKRGKSIGEGPQDFDDMNLDSNKLQQSLDYFYNDHAPNKIGGRKEAGSFKGYKVVTFTKAPDTLMFLVNKNDQAVFYVGYITFKDGIAVGNVRSNGKVRATEVYAYLVDKFGTLYSDNKQTPQGRKIWSDLAKFFPDIEVTDTGDRLQATKESIEENFADGEKRGKSKPGRFKKAGVSCKGSVTSLRKKAKNSSGERQKGYHWCANMKSGRKKK